MFVGLLVFGLLVGAVALWERTLRPRRRPDVPPAARGQRAYAVGAGLSGFGVIVFSGLSVSAASPEWTWLAGFSGLAAAVAIGLFVWTWSRVLLALR
ncbi:hypothetical protein [Nocardioides flavescens]|uniref:Uncharacterized protein n=1 Tax=Nocardioides flavescens TaxID=2691959 RepID=A0A6L7F495_9ACTN|nr:hypothetical protein [Nocardioides flavescens]MXG92083.1 hypothetical protein [Nocardioides flavescens]